MTTMAERRAAAAARIKAMTEAAQATVKKDNSRKPRIRVHAGGVVTTVMLKRALGIETAAETISRWAESKREEHKVGSVCPHCCGTGRYVLHTKPGNNKCYRCDGKGRLNAKDLAFLDRRLGGAGPVCWVVTAAAA